MLFESTIGTFLLLICGGTYLKKTIKINNYKNENYGKPMCINVGIFKAKLFKIIITRRVPMISVMN